MTKQGNSWSAFHYDFATPGKSPIIWGVFVLVPLLLVACAWTVLAPLNSAAIASGEIVVHSQRKTVQHFEGGLVSAISTTEGMWVKKGSPLLEIQDLSERAKIQSLVTELANLDAQIARLEAERDKLETPNFSNMGDHVDEISLETVQNYQAIHLGVFNQLVEIAKSTRELSVSRKVQLQREIDGLVAQLEAKKDEQKLVEKQVARQVSLFDQGYAPEHQLDDIRRTLYSLRGEIGALEASIAKLHRSIVDQDIELSRSENDRITALLGELHQTQIVVENKTQELTTLRDRRMRSIIRAPVSGRVLGLKVHTLGAVVTPGSTLMDIVPDDDRLIIEAKVLPSDIDLVRPNMEAKVQLSAFKANKVEKLSAALKTISGDIIDDELTGEKYFLARLEFSEESIGLLPDEVELAPGMPVDVFLIAGERTFADYLISPIMDSVYRAFREE